MPSSTVPPCAVKLARVDVCNPRLPSSAREIADDRLLAVGEHQRGDRRALVLVVGTEPEDVVARHRQRVRGAALADRQHAALLGDRFDRPHLGARLRADHDADAVVREVLQRGGGEVGVELGVGDLDLDAQVAADLLQVGVDVVGGQLHRGLARLAERRPSPGQRQQAADPQRVRLLRAAAPTAAAGDEEEQRGQPPLHSAHHRRTIADHAAAAAARLPSVLLCGLCGEISADGALVAQRGDPLPVVAELEQHLLGVLAELRRHGRHRARACRRNRPGSATMSASPSATCVGDERAAGARLRIVDHLATTVCTGAHHMPARSKAAAQCAIGLAGEDLVERRRRTRSACSRRTRMFAKRLIVAAARARRRRAPDRASDGRPAGRAARTSLPSLLR